MSQDTSTANTSTTPTSPIAPADTDGVAPSKRRSVDDRWRDNPGRQAAYGLLTGVVLMMSGLLRGATTKSVSYDEWNDIPTLRSTWHMTPLGWMFIASGLLGVIVTIVRYRRYSGR